MVVFEWKNCASGFVGETRRNGGGFGKTFIGHIKMQFTWWKNGGKRETYCFSEACCVNKSKGYVLMVSYQI